MHTLQHDGLVMGIHPALYGCCLYAYKRRKYISPTNVRANIPFPTKLGRVTVGRLLDERIERRSRKRLKASSMRKNPVCLQLHILQFTLHHYYDIHSQMLLFLYTYLRISGLTFLPLLGM